MIYVWAAPRAAASDSLAQELRCSPIMIYMHASPLPQLFLPPSRAPPRGPICCVAAALALMCLTAAGCCRHKSECEAILGPTAHRSPCCPCSLPRKDRTPQHCPSNSPLLPLSPGSRDNLFSSGSRWAQHRDGSIFSYVQKVPIYLGAPILSSFPWVGRVACERLQERACVSPSVCRLGPEQSKKKTMQGDKDRWHWGTLKELKT